MGNGRQEQRVEKPGIGRRRDGEREREMSGLRRREGEEWRAATGESERALGWESQRWVRDGSHGGSVKRNRKQSNRNHRIEI